MKCKDFCGKDVLTSFEALMSDLGTLGDDLPREQQAIKARCFHASGTLICLDMECPRLFFEGC